MPVKVPTALTGSVRADYDSTCGQTTTLLGAGERSSAAYGRPRSSQCGGAHARRLARAAANAAARTHAREAALRRAAEGLLGGGGTGAGTLNASGSGDVGCLLFMKRLDLSLT